MDDLVQWLGVQFDEDERIARSAGGVVYVDWTEGGWVEAEAPKAEWKGPGDDGRHVGSVRRAEDRAHIAEHDPARVLREIDAKRQLVRELLEYEAQFDSDRGCGHDADYFASGLHNGHMPKDILGLRLLASGYSHRPGFREEWRP